MYTVVGWNNATQNAHELVPESVNVTLYGKYFADVSTDWNREIILDYLSGP